MGRSLIRAVLVIVLVCGGSFAAVGGGWSGVSTQPSSDADLPAHGIIKTHRVDIMSPKDYFEADSPEKAKRAEEILRALDMNDEVISRSEIWFDTQKRLWRLSVVDIRDLRELAARKNLTDEEARRACKTGIVLGGLDGQRSVSYDPGSRLAQIEQASPGRQFVSRVPFEFGIVSKAVLSSPAEDVQVQGRGCKRVVRSGDYGSMTTIWDPELKNRFRQKTMFSQDGLPRSEQSASDYRKIDEHWLPFHYEERQWSSGTRQIKLTRTIDVEAADFKTPLPADAFSVQLPEGTTVMDKIHHSTFVIGEPVTVTLESAPLLRENHKEFVRPTTQP